MIPLSALRALPKIDLHRHLEGSQRPETLWEFHERFEAGRHASLAEFKSACTVEKGSAPGFLPFLEKFNALRFQYGALENIERVAAEAVEDAAADGVIYLELRFSPVFFARRLLSGEAAEAPVSVEQAADAAEAVVGGARGAAARCGMRVEFIATCARQFGVETNRPTLELLHRLIGASFAGLDLAGDEACGTLDFLPAFRDWKSAGKSITMHAGEDPLGAGARNVAEAVDRLGVYRIGHGVRAIEDPALVQRLANSGVTLEMCPTSNLQTRAVESPAGHPLKKFLNARVRATINTDDPAICGTTLSEEYALATERMGLSAGDLKRCALDAARAAFLSENERRELSEKIERGWAPHMQSAQRQPHQSSNG